MAFRAGEDETEIITGLAAVTQAHKNPKNTFLDVRSLLEDESKQTVHIPAMDKDITVTELASHFFRNIHDQIKQQVGKPVRDFVVSVPDSLCEDGATRTRLIEAAQAGGAVEGAARPAAARAPQRSRPAPRTPMPEASHP